jgi:hypothetical protein
MAVSIDQLQAYNNGYELYEILNQAMPAEALAQVGSGCHLWLFFNRSTRLFIFV